MATSLKELKKNRKNRFDSLKNKVDNLDKQNSNNYSDERFWQPSVDESGNGYAVIRFLDAPKGEADPYVRLFSHGFKGPNGWYIENSLTTIRQDDPASDYNSRLWNSGVESDKAIARAQKRKLSYISNIYVIKDPVNPENEGQVFLYRYGKKIFDMIKDSMEPEFEDEEPVNVFDFWEGANFRLKIRKVEGYRNYDKSNFEDPSPLFEDDAAIEEVWEKEYSLQQFIDESNFKSYDELKHRLDTVLGINTTASMLYRPGEVMQETVENHEASQQAIQNEISSKKENVTSGFEDEITPEDSEKSAEDTDDYFKNLAQSL